jgi:hypothetical protein
MAEEREMDLGKRARDIGQGDRDSDPEMSRIRKRAEETGGSGIPARTDMPDFTSGPGYTGQIPPETNSPEGADWNAGSGHAKP